MRIGIDATWWTNWRGVGRFTRGLITALLEFDRDNEYVLFFDRTYPECADVPAGARHVTVATSAAQVDALGLFSHRSVADLIRMSFAVAREPLDLFFWPSIDGYFPLVRPAAAIVMIHDVISETMPAMLPDPAARRRRRLKVRVARAQSRALAVGSERVRRQVDAMWPTSMVGVIPYGVSDLFRPTASRDAAARVVLERFGIATPFLLHVGGTGPNKNIPTLLDSFRAVLSEPHTANVTLVCVGRREDDAGYAEAAEIERRLADPVLRDRVKLMGFQPDEALVPLYQSATALVLPSRHEGFGLPALEAVSCGTPAVVTQESPLPELLGGAALAIDPDDGAGLTIAMRRMLGDDAAVLRAAAARRAVAFSWRASATAALDLFARATNRPPS